MLAVVILYWLCRKQPMPIVQGYWQPTLLKRDIPEHKSQEAKSVSAASAVFAQGSA